MTAKGESEDSHSPSHRRLYQRHRPKPVPSFALQIELVDERRPLLEFVHEIGAEILGRAAHDRNVEIRLVFLNVGLLQQGSRIDM
jgi:hypothetical protein